MFRESKVCNNDWLIHSWVWTLWPVSTLTCSFRGILFFRFNKDSCSCMFSSSLLKKQRLLRQKYITFCNKWLNLWLRTDVFRFSNQFMDWFIEATQQISPRPLRNLLTPRCSLPGSESRYSCALTSNRPRKKRTRKIFKGKCLKEAPYHNWVATM